jgi:hypothetical protein
LYCRWLPSCTTRRQPSLSTSLMASRIFIPNLQTTEETGDIQPGNRGQTGRSPVSPEIFRSFSPLFICHGRIARGVDRRRKPIVCPTRRDVPPIPLKSSARFPHSSFITAGFAAWWRLMRRATSPSAAMPAVFEGDPDRLVYLDRRASIAGNLYSQAANRNLHAASRIHRIGFVIMPGWQSDVYSATRITSLTLRNP